MAAGVLIVAIGRGTKQLSRYLACTKTYETVVLFGASTDTYDCTGIVDERASYVHVTRELVEERLVGFRGKISQMPPIYSALKVDGMKACEYARTGKALPRELEAREMDVDECTLLDWYAGGEHDFNTRQDEALAQAPAARIRLRVSSGFYVRSFAHDLGLACASRSHMASLLRTRQADYTTDRDSTPEVLIAALTYGELGAGEEIWAAKLKPQLRAWVVANPVATGHVNGRSEETKRRLGEVRDTKPRQRFRGGWEADTKQDRIKQQGGRYKGKWGKKPRVEIDPAAAAEPEGPGPIEGS